MNPSFCHLHCHTTYSLLDGASEITDLLQHNKALGMNALAITDHGNMFGVPKFVTQAQREGVLPIIGCECYLSEDMYNRKDKTRYHQLLLAKNATGYQNLSRLCSLAFTEGYYYKPRIDKKRLMQYAEGLIATTCCLAAEVPQTILKEGEEAAEKIFLAYLDIFGEDYYIELQRHGLPEQEQCNEVLIRWSKKHNVKVIATNDVHYVRQQDSLAQDVMLCLQTGKNYNDPNRMRFNGNEFYLKSPQEMLSTFPQVPQAIYNTLEVAAKVEPLNLERDILMPSFPLPPPFADQHSYLRHLTFERAPKRYRDVLAEPVLQRLEFELNMIQKMNFSGYYLIVQDMIQAAKKLGVWVGPGRGSIAGSAVAYALGITDIDPLTYGLFFERFLNPERVSSPDMDIDFDDQGRQRVIDYVVERYGYEHVAHVITFNTLGAKSAIRDVARVLELPIAEANRLAKLVPDKLGMTLSEAFKKVPELQKYRSQPNTIEGKICTLAETLQGSPRHTGIHAAAIIISPKKLIQLTPIKTDKNTNLLVTQYDGSFIERAGFLKMDLLGLRTLSILRDAIALVEKVYSATIDLKNIPFDDPKTIQLYQRGETVGIFQFESDGMRSYLRQLRPTKLNHLIAMNALYRPGPMQNIPTYIARMHGKEKVTYLHPLLKDILASTYGIPVYQEQIMQIAQILAGYSLGGADLLRRAMGKRKPEEMQKQEMLFIKGAQKTNQIEPHVAKEIFLYLSPFAKYGFNLSHAVAYTQLSFQTAYLKAHFPTAYMASLLIHHQHNMDKIVFFIQESKKMGIQVKGPNINRSQLQFSSDAPGIIHFGLAAIKGSGEKAVVDIIAEREENGPFQSLATLIERMMQRNAKPTRKILETLALSGCFDQLPDASHRKQYIYAEPKQPTFIEKLLQYQQKRHKKKQNRQQSLFPTQLLATTQETPLPPTCEPYTDLEQLKIEKELVGFYIEKHPLDHFHNEIKYLCNTDTQQLLNNPIHKNVALAGMITQVTRRYNKRNSPFAIVSLEDMQGTCDFFLFGERYAKYQHLLTEGQFIWLQGNIEKRYAHAQTHEFRPQTIFPLQHILEQRTETIQLQLTPTKIEHTLVDQLIHLLKRHPGQCPIEITLPHPPSQTHITAKVRKFRITPSNNLLTALDQLHLEYKIKIRTA